MIGIINKIFKYVMSRTNNSYSYEGMSVNLQWNNDTHWYRLSFTNGYECEPLDID